jgi:hypothetical protein
LNPSSMTIGRSVSAIGGRQIPPIDPVGRGRTTGAAPMRTLVDGTRHCGLGPKETETPPTRLAWARPAKAGPPDENRRQGSGQTHRRRHGRRLPPKRKRQSFGIVQPALNCTRRTARPPCGALWRRENELPTWTAQ